MTSPSRPPRVSGARRARLPETQSRRNFRLGVLNGAIYQAGESFVDSNTVVPLFLSRLTGSNALIGAASAMNDMGWLLPQVFVAPWAKRFPRQIVLYRGAAIVRGIALAAIAALIWPLRDHPAALLAVFFACYGIFSLGAGFGGVAFMEVVARTVPARRLGSFWSQRLFWGGLGGAAVGLAVREILKLEDPGPKFALLFGLAALFASAAYAMFSAIVEPDTAPSRTPGSPLVLLRQGVGMLRGDATFRRLLLSRASLSVWFTVSPFMVLFAVNDLGGGARAAGTFLFSRIAGYVLGNLAWQPLSKRRGTRAVMRVATFGAGAIALLAFVVAVLSPWGAGRLSAGAAVILLEAIAFLGGATQSGMLVGYASLVLELAPPDQRQGFVSLANTFVAPTMLLPALGGLVVDWVHAPALFAGCGVVAFAGFVAAMGLPPSGSRPGAEAIEPRAAAGLATGDEP